MTECPICERTEAVVDGYCHNCSQDLNDIVEVTKGITNLQEMHQILGLKEGEELPELQNLVVDVKGSITGASDPLSTEQLVKVRKALEMRIKRWHHPSDIIDSCIYTMCLECIRMIEEELQERNDRQY